VLTGLLTFFSGMYLGRHDPGAMRGAAIHDPLAVLAVTHPHLLERARRHVTVETLGEHTRGMTIIDQRKLVERHDPNCDVLTEVDDDAAFEVVIEAIEHFSR